MERATSAHDSGGGMFRGRGLHGGGEVAAESDGLAERPERGAAELPQASARYKASRPYTRQGILEVIGLKPIPAAR